jgi:excinuclease UvrABC helicase subunit UvrB
MRTKELEMAQKALALEEINKDRPVEEVVREKEQEMRSAANALQFELAAILRDEIKTLKHKGSGVVARAAEFNGRTR